MVHFGVLLIQMEWFQVLGFLGLFVVFSGAQNTPRYGEKMVLQKYSRQMYLQSYTFSIIKARYRRSSLFVVIEDNK